MADENEGLRREPSGTGRDLYWCWNLNEPVLLTFAPNDRPRCRNCNAEGDDPLAPFDEYRHTFIGSVLKPVVDLPDISRQTHHWKAEVIA